MTSKPTVREGLAEAADFARDVWRDCWPVMLVIVLGRTLVFLGNHASPSEWSPWLWPQIGWVLSAAYVPLFGALYRLGVGGEALDSLGWGGFQWTGVEWRLLGVWTVLSFALSICATPLCIVSFPLLYLFQHHPVSLGLLGGWSLASILLSPFWLVFAAFALFMWGRLGLAAAATTARMRVSPFASWGLTRGLGWTIGLAWLIAQLPMVIGWAALWAMGVAEAGDLSTPPPETWPLIDALGAGVVVAVLAAVIQVPLSVGLLAGFYRWLSEDESAPRAVETPDAAVAEAVAAEAAVEAPVPPEDTDGPLSIWPHTVLPRGLFRRKAEEAEAPPHDADILPHEPETHAPHDHEPEPPEPEPPEPEPFEPEPPEQAPPAEEPPVSVEEAEVHVHPEPPLASAPEPDQTEPDQIHEIGPDSEPRAHE